MTKIIYVEREIKDHFRTKLICSKVSNPNHIINRFSGSLIKETKVLNFKRIILH